MIPTLIFTYGWPAAGKTTYSMQYCITHKNCVRISADSIRGELYGSEDIYGDGLVIYHAILERMRDELLNGHDVIYDATNLRKQFRLDYLNKIADIQCIKIIKHIVADKDVCIKRHIWRGRNIPIEQLMPFFDIDEPPTYDEGWNKIEVVKL